MKKNVKRLLAALFVTALVVPMIACEKKGPAEELGEKVDEAVEEVKDEVDDHTDG